MKSLSIEQENAEVLATMLEQGLAAVLAEYPVDHVTGIGEYRDTLIGLRQIAWVALRCRHDSGRGPAM